MSVGIFTWSAWNVSFHRKPKCVLQSVRHERTRTRAHAHTHTNTNTISHRHTRALIQEHKSSNTLMYIAGPAIGLRMPSARSLPRYTQMGIPYPLLARMKIFIIMHMVTPVFIWSRASSHSYLSAPCGTRLFIVPWCPRLASCTWRKVCIMLCIESCAKTITLELSVGSSSSHTCAKMQTHKIWNAVPDV